MLVDRQTEFEIEKRRHRDDDDKEDGDRGRRGRIEPVPVVIGVPVPVIFSPYSGTAVTGREFLLSGRTVGRARVLISVVSGMGPVSAGSFNLETIADHNGLFSVMIRPSIVQRGIQRRVTVQSYLEGAQSPPATLIVYQQ